MNATVTYRIGFVIEDALGHVTHMANLHAFAARDPEIAPTWMPIPHRHADILERLPGLPFSLKVGLRARGEIRKGLFGLGLDCLLIHTQALAVASHDLMSRIPTVISLDATPENFREIAVAYDARVSQGWLARVKRRQFVRTFAAAHGIVAWSDWVKDSLVRDYEVHEDKVMVIPSGINLALWPAKHEYSPPSQRLRILFVGGDFVRKGGDLLLRAFREALHETCELDIVTQDASIAPEPGVRVHRGMTPNAPALLQLYQAADVFVLPSRGDATPFAVLEAMASGLPVIATRVGALHEIVRDQVTGFLIERGDLAALIDRLTHLAARRELLATLGQVGRETVVEGFDAARNYTRLLACLKQVAAFQPAQRAS